MEAYNEENFSGKSIDHLGLVADVIDDLGIIKLIDDRLPIQKGSGSKVTMGERVAAMILNGLGFIDTRLYMFPEFLEKKPVNRLFGKEISPDWFNDDALGRFLDACSSYGTTKLFTELSFIIGSEKNLLGKSAHFDTSTLQLYGEYPDSENTKEETPVPARGYSKSHRHDLKQMVINLATTGKANFPLWMESHSGNASDKKVLPAAALRMQQFCEQLDGVPDFMYVADSAVYSNILEHSAHMKWLTRVPNNILQAKQLLQEENTNLSWEGLPDGYSYYATESEYGSVKQRWLLIFSQQAYKREINTLDKNINKELTEIEKDWWHLGNEIFSCVSDAEIASKKLIKKVKYHQIHIKASKIYEHEGRGRPKKDAQAKVKGYKIEFSIKADEAKINTAKLKKGRFILSTNELDKNILPDNEVLQEYKKQSGTESGFKFIKDNTFEIDSVFLKTPERIDALMMVMTLCLMVYGYSQYALRKSLQEAGETIPNQKRKPTTKPSMKWVYFLFSGVHELTINIGETTKEIVINVNSLLKKIISYFGPKAQAIYLNPS